MCNPLRYLEMKSPFLHFFSPACKMHQPHPHIGGGAGPSGLLIVGTDSPITEREAIPQGLTVSYRPRIRSKIPSSGTVVPSTDQSEIGRTHAGYTSSDRAIALLRYRRPDLFDPDTEPQARI